MIAALPLTKMFVRGALIILSAPENARDARAEEAEEEARTSRVRHLTPLIRQRSSGTRKSRTGSMTSPRPTGTWSRRAGQDDNDEERETLFTCVFAPCKEAEMHSRGHERPTRLKIKAARGRSPKFTRLITRAFISRTRVPFRYLHILFYGSTSSFDTQICMQEKIYTYI